MAIYSFLLLCLCVGFYFWRTVGYFCLLLITGIIFFSWQYRYITAHFCIISLSICSATDLHTPATELIRLVRVYSTSWEEKSAALKKLHSDYDSKHKQLNIAVRRLQLIDAQVSTFKLLWLNIARSMLITAVNTEYDR